MFCIHCGGALKYFKLAKENGYSQSALAPYCRELGLDPDMV